MRALNIVVGLSLALTGCKQIFGLDSPTHLDAGGPIATIGFGAPTTLSDEASGVVGIPVLLTEVTDSEVTVAFSILGGTATDGEDYTIDQDLVVIPPGSQSGTLEVAIAADQVLEDDETIELSLVNPRGATLGLAQHTVTISATVLPRVNFVAMASSIGETSTRQSLMVTLDMPSTIPVNVMLGTSGTATVPADVALVANPVTFDAGSTAQVVQVDVQHDTLDEEDETAIITLLSADAAIVGTMPSHTLTITDNDNPPTVSLTPASETVAEDVGTATITVQLNMPSGKDITVPFTAGGSAVVTTDYTYGTTSPLTIPAGAMTGTITINVVDDTTDEASKILATTLGLPTNGQLGAPNVHLLTITDNEVTCVGPTGTAFQVCYDNAPTTAASLPSSLDTDDGALCQDTLPIGWTAAGQPDACVIWATSVTGNNTVVTGSRPLVIAATGTISIGNSLDVSSRRSASRIGPGAPSNLCAVFPMAAGGSASGAGGGAGGSFMTKGGSGGTGPLATGGSAPNPNAAEPTVLRAGCSGQRGGMGDSSPGGPPGAGGGALYLAAGTSITIANNAYVAASGAGATPVSALPDDAGGSGGGSGGMIRLYAPTISASGAAIMANGGGGAEGNTENDVGNPGGDHDPDSPLQPAPGGMTAGGGGNGGNGFAGPFAAGGGANSLNGGGGGGGGGGGLIRSNVALTGAEVSAGSIVIQ